jgi:hypothetical protein
MKLYWGPGTQVQVNGVPGVVRDVYQRIYVWVDPASHVHGRWIELKNVEAVLEPPPFADSI